MELQLVSFELAKKLKKVGCYITNEIVHDGAFEENTIQFYNDSGNLCTETDYLSSCCDPNVDEYSEIPSPSLELAKMWFREKYNIFINIECGFELGEYRFTVAEEQEFRTIYFNSTDAIVKHRSYEKALEAGLLKACTLIK